MEQKTVCFGKGKNKIPLYTITLDRALNKDWTVRTTACDCLANEVEELDWTFFRSWIKAKLYFHKHYKELREMCNKEFF